MILLGKNFSDLTITITTYYRDYILLQGKGYFTSLFIFFFPFHIIILFNSDKEIGVCGLSSVMESCFEDISFFRLHVFTSQEMEEVCG